jgi:hypothetical protein
MAVRKGDVMIIMKGFPDHYIQANDIKFQGREGSWKTTPGLIAKAINDSPSEWVTLGGSLPKPSINWTLKRD